MAYGGGGANPGQPCAYLKVAAGWITPTLLSTAQAGLTVRSTPNDIYKFPDPGHANEYYLVDNREKTGRDADIPDSGVAIWHIDTNGSNNNNAMTPSSHYLVTLVQADGRWDMEHDINSGDATDLYDQASYTRCSPSTYPNTNWWDGSVSGLNLDHISAAGPSMTFTFGEPYTLGVTPQVGLAASGFKGGPFTPTSQTYTLHNSGGSSINWAASKTSSWLTLSKSSGTLGAGASDTVTVSLAAGATSLAVGSYADDVQFTDLATGGGPVRHASLEVKNFSFVWNAIASSQRVNSPFSVKIAALDTHGTTATTFTGTANLSAEKTITLGADSNSCVWFPMWTNQNVERTQVIYLASELGMGAGPLSSLDLKVGSVPPETMHNWTIRMKHTSLSEYDQNSGWDGTGWTTVYQGDTTIGSNGWLRFAFSTPFSYNGTDNVMVDFSFNNSSHSDGGTCYSYDTTGNRTLEYSTSDSVADPLTWSGSSEPSSALPYVLSIRFRQNLSITPTVSGSFVNGIWSGSLSVLAAGTQLDLYAQDAAGHSGTSGLFDVISDLAVTPSNDLVTSGPLGGSFSPASRTYTLTNTGANALNWTAAKTAAWVTLSKASGTLAGGATDTVTVSIGTAANSLAAGAYSDTITFSDLTHSTQQTRHATLTVRPISAFVWNAIASPQTSNVAFPVTLRAVDSGGNTVHGFTGTANLSAASGAPVAIGNGAVNWNFPFYTYYHDSRTQVIYLASEIGSAGRINSLQLDVTGLPGQTLTNWTIRMKHTSLAAYAALEWETTGWTVVYQADQTISSTGWVRFDFSTPFDYNGFDNLMIDFSVNNSSWTSSGGCQATTEGVIRSVVGYSDSNDGDPLTWSGSAANLLSAYQIPNVILGMGQAHPLTPTTTGSFTSGVWSGQVTVGEFAPGVHLLADDGSGHTGASGVFDVFSNLAITPPDDLLTSGPLGGAFNPAAKTYTLTNIGSTALNWSAAKTAAWLTLSKASGTLAGGATDTVTVSLGSGANSLTAGAYSDTITFSDLTHSLQQTRHASVTVRPMSGFAWNAIPSPQGSNTPFPVTVRAVDAVGNTARGFTGSANLSAVTGSSVPVGSETDNPLWLPINTAYRVSRTQVIYLASEIGRAGPISSLNLDVNQVPGMTLSNWTIRMKHTSLSDYVSAADWDSNGWTVVYQADESMVSAGWVRFNFSTPFPYNGTDNLMIDFSFNNDSYTPDGLGYCYCTYTSEDRTLLAFSGGSDGDPLDWSGTSPAGSAYSLIPNVVLGFAQSHPFTPTTTGSFSAGVWNGQATVGEVATGVSLQAIDGAEHLGLSNAFNLTAMVNNVTSAHANGSFKTGEVIDVNVVFSAPVVVVGTPTLTLETGTVDRTVNYVSGSGTNTLTFRYTVQTGDTSADLDCKASSSLALNGGTVRTTGAVTLDAALTLPAPGAAGSLGANKALQIDTQAPTVLISSTAPNPTSLLPIPVTVAFSEPVSGFTASSLTLTNASVVNFSGSGASYSFGLNTSQSGTVSVGIGAGVATDGAGNANLPATALSRTYTGLLAVDVSIFTVE